MPFGLSRFKEALADPATQIHVQEQYAEDKNREYGVTLRLRKGGAQDEYGFLHFHYKPNSEQAAKLGMLPECSAHFKEGHAKAARQMGELPPADAYSLYMMLMVLKPPKNPGKGADPKLAANSWEKMYRRITVPMIRDLINSQRLDKLAAIYRSQIWLLEYWEQEAWTMFMNWNAS